MKKLDAVEEARALMEEGQDWPLYRMVLEKDTVRETAVRASQALEEAAHKVKSSWSDDLKKAYAELSALASLDHNPAARRRYEKAKRAAAHVDARVKLAAKRVKDADDEAYRVTADAGAMFAEAARHWSASMARVAASKMLDSYDLRERAIRKAEAARRHPGPGGRRKS